MSNRILVVDDEPHILNIIKFNLKRAGFDVITAKNGEEGFQMAQSGKPDIIVSDVMMPKMDGFTFCTLVKTTPETKDIPFIFLTAKGQSMDKDKGEDFGAIYLTKPFSPKQLVEKIKEMIS